MPRVVETPANDTPVWGCLDGVVEAGAGRARGLGFPTANLVLGQAAAPAPGVYAGWAGIDGEAAVRPAMLYLGSAPTFGAEPRRLEVHLFDFSGDIYGCRLRVRFGTRLAPERRYASPAMLAVAIRRLAWAARSTLGCEPGSGRMA